MSLRENLEISMKNALRSGDDVTKRTVRMALAAIKQTEIDRRIQLDDTGITSIIQKEIKTRRESLEEAQQANRPDLVASCQAEIEVLKGFLPEEMSESDLLDLVKAALAESGASSMADMGKVMKLLLPRLQGRAPNDRVSQVVRRLLQ